MMMTSIAKLGSRVSAFVRRVTESKRDRVARELQAHAVTQLEQFFSVFAPGMFTRKDPDFLGTTQGVNSLNDMYGDRVLARMRHLQFSNPVVRGALEKLITSTLSQGIWITPKTGNPNLDAMIADDWEQYSARVDAAGKTRTEDRQRDVLREYLATGEFFTFDTVIRDYITGEWRPVTEVVVRERLPMGGPWNTYAVGATDNTIRQSIEITPDGQHVAYHVLAAPPHDSWLVNAAQPIRMPASQMRHTLSTEITGQLRGVSPFAAAIFSLRDEEAFIEAALWLARSAMAQGVIIKGVNPGVRGSDGSLGGNPGAGVPSQADPNGSGFGGLVDGLGQPLSATMPNAVSYITKRDVDVMTLGGNLPPPAMEMAVNLLQRRVALCLGRSYEGLTGDLAGSSYASARMGRMSDQNVDRYWQRIVFEKHELPAYQHFVRVRAMTGAYDKYLGSTTMRNLLRCTPQYPGHDWVDPKSEAAAAETEVRMGTRSRRNICESKGRDFDQTVREIVEEEAMFARLRQEKGLPAQTADKAAPAASEPDADDSEDNSQQAKVRLVV